MKRRWFFALVAMFSWFSACADSPDHIEPIEMRGVGMVVTYQLAQGANNKEGVDARSDTGYHLFGASMMTATGGGGTNHLGVAAIPRWVRVTWREGMTAHLPDKTGRYATGKVVGDYTVQVLSRIPREAFDLARAGRKRFLVLIFRIRDDGVDFGWMIRLQDGVPFVTLMKGGDL